MNKKTLLQVFIILLIIFISIFLYFKYFNNSSKNLEITSTEQNINISKSERSNFIENINYISSDVRGNKYQITAKQAVINLDNPDIMLLENITAYIHIKNSNTVTITSGSAKYNSTNYDTNFSKNVIVVYPDHKLTGDYLDFSFLNNFGKMYEDIIYINNQINLIADKIEIDFITKDTKIFMNDHTKNVIVKGKK